MDEMEFLREKKERLTAELWDVMGELSMEAAKRAGHRMEKMPSGQARWDRRPAVAGRRRSTLS